MNADQAQIRLIGHVGVDSGQIVIVDPCYAEWSDEVPATVLDTAFGDDVYPVFAELDEEGRPLRIIIDMRPPHGGVEERS